MLAAAAAARWCYSAGAAIVDDVKIASPATKTNSENYISMTSRQGFDQVNELSLLIFTYVCTSRESTQYYLVCFLDYYFVVNI